MTLKDRLKATGTTARALSKRNGATPATLSRNLNSDRPEPRYVADVEALEIMTPEQRERWLGRDAG